MKKLCHCHWICYTIFLQKENVSAESEGKDENIDFSRSSNPEFKGEHQVMEYEMDPSSFLMIKSEPQVY